MKWVKTERGWGADLEKTNFINSTDFNLKKKTSAKFVKFSAKLESLNVQFWNNFKNIIFIASKWWKICKYYVNTMVISCSTCQKEEKNAKIAGGFFRPIEIYYGVCRRNGNQILPHFDVLKFEIGLIKEDKIKFSNFDKITFFLSFFFSNYVGLY